MVELCRHQRHTTTTIHTTIIHTHIHNGHQRIVNSITITNSNTDTRIHNQLYIHTLYYVS